MTNPTIPNAQSQMVDASQFPTREWYTFLRQTLAQLQAQVAQVDSLLGIVNGVQTQVAGIPTLTYWGQIQGTVTDQTDVAPLDSPAFTTAVGFNGSAAIAKQTVSGAKGGNVALANLLTALAAVGLINDTTT